MKILIFGSCVSRDILSHDTSKSLTLVDYYARSSIAALCSSDIQRAPDTSRIPSAFQRKMVENEISRNFLKQLPGLDFDLLLLDLIDERFDLVEVEKDAYLTVSSEFMQTGFVTKAIKESGAWVKSGSVRYRALWLRGLQRLVATFQRLGILERVIVNKVFWASSFDNGERLPDKFHPAYINQANEHLAWMYQQLERHLGHSQFLVPRDDSLKSGRSHIWGVSPFHYGDRYYQEALEGLPKLGASRPLGMFPMSNHLPTNA